MPTEHWLPVKKFPNYEVSDFGRVRNITTGRVLKARLCSGYPSVVLSDGVEKIDVGVHIIEFDAFIGLTPGMVINHKNKIRSDNRLINLHQTTHQINLLHGGSLYPNVEELCDDPDLTARLIKEDFKIIFDTMKKVRFSIPRAAKTLNISTTGIRRKIRRAHNG